MSSTSLGHYFKRPWQNNSQTQHSTPGCFQAAVRKLRVECEASEEDTVRASRAIGKAQSRQPDSRGSHVGFSGTLCELLFNQSTQQIFKREDQLINMIMRLQDSLDYLS